MVLSCHLFPNHYSAVHTAWLWLVFPVDDADRLVNNGVLTNGVYRGAVWCGVKREEPQCKECLGVPGFQDILRFRTCSNPELRVILAPFQWNCRQLFLFGDHTAKKRSQNDCGRSCTTACSLQLPWCLAILFVWGAWVRVSERSCRVED